MRLLLLLLGICLLFVPARAMAEPVSLLLPAYFPEVWRLRAGDDPAWADPELDDHDWEPLALYQGWNFDPRFRWEPVVWYRAHVAVAPIEGQELALTLVVQGAADVYANGRLIGSIGEVGHRAGLIGPHVVPLPRDLLGPDGKIDVAVRVWLPATHLLQGGALYGGLLVGEREFLVVDQVARQHVRRVDGTRTVIECVLAVLVGLAHLVLFARRRDLRAHLWFGAGTLAQGIWLAIDASVFWQWIAPFAGTSTVQSVLMASYFSAMLMFCVHFFRADPRFGRVIAAYTFLGTGANLHVWVMSGGTNAMYLVFLMAPGLLFALASLATGIRKGIVGSGTVGAGMAIFLLWPVTIGLVNAGLIEQPWAHGMRAVGSLALTGAMVLGLAEQFGASLDELERTYKAARWFVPYELLERLGRTKIGDVRRGDAARLEMTMLFFDIRGFTTLAEAHPPEKTFAFVNALFDRLEPHIRGNRGFVIQFTGDGFLALFPDADGAVQAALDQLRSLATFRDPLLGGEPIRVGIGVHTGPMMLGTIGGSDQLLAGVVADAANLASRIEGMTKVYGVSVLISEVTRDRLVHPERFVLRELDRVVAKGRREPIGVIEVCDAVAPAPFAPAYQSYRAGAFGEALTGFEACAGDGPAAVLAERCRRFLAAPPASWDGVWRLDTK